MTWSLFLNCCYHLFFAYAGHKQQIQIKESPKIITKNFTRWLKNQMHQPIPSQVNNTFAQRNNVDQHLHSGWELRAKKPQVCRNHSRFHRPHIFTQCGNKCMQLLHEKCFRKVQPCSNTSKSLLLMITLTVKTFSDLNRCLESHLTSCFACFPIYSSVFYKSTRLFCRNGIQFFSRQTSFHKCIVLYPFLFQMIKWSAFLLLYEHSNSMHHL